jgi:hypothetical protein
VYSAGIGTVSRILLLPAAPPTDHDH